MHVFGSDFRQERKNDPKTLSERPKSDKWKSENAKILVNGAKSGFFGHPKQQHLAVFQDSDLKFCTHIHRQVFLYIYTVFWKFKKKFLNIFEKHFFMIFTNYNFLHKKIEIWDSSLIVMFNLHVLLKANRFFLENCTRGDDSRVPLFFTEIWRTCRHCDVIYDRPIRALAIPFVRLSKVDAGKSMQSLVAISYFVF